MPLTSGSHIRYVHIVAHVNLPLKLTMGEGPNVTMHIETAIEDININSPFQGLCQKMTVKILSFSAEAFPAEKAYVLSGMKADIMCL